MRRVNRIFIQGLVSILPIAVSIYIAYAGVLIVDDFLGRVLRVILKDYYIPGIGFLAALILIFFVGLFVNNILGAGLLRAIEKRFTKIPFIKAIYSPLRDLMNLFSQSDSQGLKSVVLVPLTEEIRLIGLVTRENFKDIENFDFKGVDDIVSVYCPFSYALGGYTVLFPKSKLIPLDIPVEKAMSLAVTGWIKAEKKKV